MTPLTSVSETEHGSAVIREYYGAHAAYGGRLWEVLCGYCGRRQITTRNRTAADHVAEYTYRNHICPTFPCGCPVHIVTDEGHQEGCDHQYEETR